MSDKIVAIHQPNFLPWPVFWHKMLNCTDFVFLMDAVYPDRGFINRSKLGEGWLTVPVQTKGKRGQRICDVKIAENSKWRRQHLGMIYQKHHGAHYFDEIFPLIEDIYSKSKVEYLVHFNNMLLDMVITRLRITGVKVHLEWSFPNLGKGADRIFNLCKYMNAEQYISGQSGPKYMDMKKFENAGIDVLVQDRFLSPTKIPSILNLLFNVEPRAAKAWLTKGMGYGIMLERGM